MQVLALISLYAGGDYHRCRRRGPVFVLLGVSPAAALALERDGPAADSILALAGAATTLATEQQHRKRLSVERAEQPSFFSLVG